MWKKQCTMNGSTPTGMFILQGMTETVKICTSVDSVCEKGQRAVTGVWCFWNQSKVNKRSLKVFLRLLMKITILSRGISFTLWHFWEGTMLCCLHVPVFRLSGVITDFFFSAFFVWWVSSRESTSCVPLITTSRLLRGCERNNTVD